MQIEQPSTLDSTVAPLIYDHVNNCVSWSVRKMFTRLNTRRSRIHLSRLEQPAKFTRYSANVQLGSSSSPNACHNFLRTPIGAEFSASAWLPHDCRPTLSRSLSLISPHRDKPPRFHAPPTTIPYQRRTIPPQRRIMMQRNHQPRQNPLKALRLARRKPA